MTGRGSAPSADCSVAVEERRSDQDAGQRQAEGRIVVQVLLAEPGVEAAQLAPLRIAQRAAIGPVRELQHRVEVLRLRVDQAASAARRRARRSASSSGLKRFGSLSCVVYSMNCT